MTSDGKKETLLSGIWTKIATLLSPKKTQAPITSESLFSNSELYSISLDSIYNNNYYNTATYGGGGTYGAATGGPYGTGGAGAITTAGTISTGGIYSVPSMNQSIIYNIGSYTMASAASSASTGIAFNIGTYDVGHDNDVTIKRKGKPDLKVAATLDLIIESLYIIIPDKNEIEQNPALKSAYENWQEKFSEHVKLMNPVKEAYDSYIMMQRLVKEEPEE